MRRIQEHHRTARRGLSTLVVGFVVLTTAVMTASYAGANPTKSSTPLEAYDSFEFELEIAFGTESGRDVTFGAKGTYNGPSDQDCVATATLSMGFDYKIRAVVIGGTTWIDDGDGPRKVRQGAFDFEDECPSSPKFWEHFPFGELPDTVHGTPETRNGIALEKFDLTTAFEALVGAGFGGFPPGVTADRLVIWRTHRHDVVVGIEVALRGSSEATCRDMLNQDPGTPSTSSCTMSLDLDLSHFNDPGNKVRPPSGSKQRTISA